MKKLIPILILIFSSGCMSPYWITSNGQKCRTAEEFSRKSEEERSEYLKNTQGLDIRIKMAMLTGIPVLGMSRKQLELTFGKLQRIKEFKTRYGLCEEWRYTNKQYYFYFKHNKLFRISKKLDEKYYIGMKDKEVLNLYGYPDDINKTVTAYGISEQWVYGGYPYRSKSTYLYFKNGKLTSWQE